MDMSVLLFDNCCGCIDLKTGCLIIGYFNVVYASIYLIVGLAVGLVAVAAPEVQDELAKHHAGAAALTVVAIIFFLIVQFHLILNIVFVIAVEKNRRGYIKVYLIINLVFLIMAVLNLLSSLGAGVFYWEQMLNSLIMIPLDAYFLLVIRSYYLKMVDQSYQPFDAA